MILVLELQVNHTQLQPQPTTPRTVQPSNQPTCLHRITVHINQPCPLWLDRPDSFNFTSIACAFRKQRITVTIPFTTLSNYLFEPTSLLRSHQTIWEESHFFVPRSFRNCINRQALSRRLNNIHRILLRACFGLLLFYDEYVGLGT
jgi:hypothetical protein